MAVAPADARRAAAIYRDPARLQIVAVGDAATIAPLLSTHGPVTVYGADGKAKQSRGQVCESSLPRGQV